MRETLTLAVHAGPAGRNRSGPARRTLAGGLTMLFLLAGTAGLFAQNTRIQAEVNTRRIGKGDPVILQISIDGSGAMGAELVEENPSSENFKLLQRPGVSTQYQFVNGQASTKKIFTFIFYALKTGKLALPVIKVDVGGTVSQSQPVEIEVVDGPVPQSRPQRQPNRDPFADMFGDESQPSGGGAANIGDDLLLRLEASRQQAWVGQPLTVSLVALYRINLQSVDQEKEGKMERCWVENVDLRNQARQLGRRQFGGKVYQSAQLKEWVLFPTRPGRLQLEPWTLKFGVVLPSRSFSIFGREEAVLRQSNPLEIAVKDFPAAGRPAGFSGLCGQFRLAAGLDKTRVKTGEGVNLKVTISGAGNFRSVPDIKLPEISGCKVYTPKTQESVRLQDGTLQGSRTWEFVLVPLDAGTVSIPAIQIPYFDPAGPAYRALSAPQLEIIAEPGAAGAATGLQAGVASLPLELKGQDIRYLHTGPALEITFPPVIYRRLWFQAAFPLLFLLAGGLAAWILIRRRQRFDLRNWARSRAAINARKALRKCEQLGRTGFSAEFFSCLYHLLQQYLEGRFGLAQIDLTSVRLRQLLSEAEVAPADAGEVIRLLQLCESSRYAPLPPGENPAGLLDSLRALLTRLEGGAK